MAPADTFDCLSAWSACRSWMPRCRWAVAEPCFLVVMVGCLSGKEMADRLPQHSLRLMIALAQCGEIASRLLRRHMRREHRHRRVGANVDDDRPVGRERGAPHRPDVRGPVDPEADKAEQLAITRIV